MKTTGFILLWLLGSVAAIGIAWSGVAVVDDEIIDPAPAVDFQDEPSGDSRPGLASAPATDTHASRRDGTERSLPTERPGTDETPQPNPTSVPATSDSSSPSSTTVPPPASPDGSQSLTFSLVGGSTAISFNSTGVSVLWATPMPGFEVKVSNESPGIKVEFRSDDHRSRIDAWWSDGPQHSIREDPQN